MGCGEGGHSLGIVGKGAEVATSPSWVEDGWGTKRKPETSPAVESTKAWVSVFPLLVPCSSHPITVSIYSVTVN